MSVGRLRRFSVLERSMNIWWDVGRLPFAKDDYVRYFYLLNPEPRGEGYFYISCFDVIDIHVYGSSVGDVCAILVKRGKISEELCSLIYSLLKRSRSVFTRVKSDFKTDYIDVIIDIFDILTTHCKGMTEWATLVNAVFSECLIQQEEEGKILPSGRSILILHNYEEVAEVYAAFEYNMYVTTGVLKGEEISTDATLKVDDLKRLRVRKKRRYASYLFSLNFDLEHLIDYYVMWGELYVHAMVVKELLSVLDSCMPKYLMQMNESAYRWGCTACNALKDVVMVERDVTVLENIHHDLKLIYNLGREGLFLRGWREVRKSIEEGG